MPSSDDRFYGEDVAYADMAEAPRRERESNAKNIAVATGTTVGVLLLAVLLIRASLPAMTPEEIVQRADYEGQQPPRYIFNLYSLKQEAKRQEQSVAKNNDQTAKNSENADATLMVVEAPSVDAGEVSSNSISASRAVVVPGQRVAVAPADKKVPAIVRVYEKSELSRDTLPVVSAIVSERVPVLAENSANGSRVVTVLPVYTIKADQTNLRSQPSTASPVLKTLKKGQTITVFDNTGIWVQVATNDGLGTTGYIHNRLLEIADID